MEQSKDVVATVPWSDICPCCGELNVYKVGEETGLVGPDGKTAYKAKAVVVDAAEIVFEVLEGLYTGTRIHYLRQRVN